LEKIDLHLYGKTRNALFGWIAGGGTVATIMSEIIAPSLSKAAHLGQISGRPLVRAG
jgi:hypothetical protein